MEVDQYLKLAGIVCFPFIGIGCILHHIAMYRIGVGGFVLGTTAGFLISHGWQSLIIAASALIFMPVILWLCILVMLYLTWASCKTAEDSNEPPLGYPTLRDIYRYFATL